uniref:Formylglycine-generating enzyme, required for sulfatase activity, contains SUMF1/FGE domain n=1 Tax=Candidatus Kentrum sp. LFY TaxID=2126342 RepID=A0A450UIF2_9GAMM|nr:MAG: Formylglycine-generating enzyme, required for sulfatase activity, contains SUMF1/FGE domain [Candidatus Kentron sp. LFY]
MPEFTLASAKWLKPLSKKLIPLEEKLAFGIRDEQTEELHDIGDVFGLSFFDLARHYIEPYCQYHDPTGHEDRQSISHVGNPVFSTINTFLKDDVPPSHDGARQMFIFSDTGMGKTSLLVMLKLSQLMDFWPQGYHCLLLKMGEETLERIIEYPNQADTVLLLDALDEDPLAWGNFEERLLSILAATGSYRRVIITCHARSFPKVVYDSRIDHGQARIDSGQVRIGSCIYPTIYLTPFDDDQVARYLARCYPDQWFDRFLRRDNFMQRRARKLVKAMDSLRFCPLLLTRIHDILALGETGIRKYNLYTFYQTLIETYLAREESKLRRRLVKPSDRESLWIICIAVATFLQSKGNRSLSQAALKQLVEELSLVADLERFDVGKGSLLERNRDGDLWFFHNSIQEFLVAHGMLSGQVDVMADAVRVTDRLLAFLKVRNKMDFRFPKQSDMQPYLPIPELHFYDVLANGDPGPRMQLIPVGEFLMGSQEGKGYKDERPQHRVRIAAPFALGTYSVTFAEYDRFCEATGRQKPSDEAWGRGRYPVINISWYDARDYCAWLSKKTGARYRLPSEAEWEYAARAGTNTNYWWGDEFRRNFANCVGCESLWDDKQTAPVGSFAPNPFGLFDTAGNVCEWTADCWHGDYRGAPVDGCPWEKREDPGDCEWRVTRGGSWISGIWYLRSANRYWFSSDSANFNVGFRLARDI